MSINLKKSDYENNNGMLTSVWGPSMWHTIHTISFNYPVKPTREEEKDYYNFIMSLEKVLPCKYCRENFPKNMKVVNKKHKTTLKKALRKGRSGFSRYMYDFHNVVNVMLGKPITLSYKDVKDRYENFRARCTLKNNEVDMKRVHKKLLKDKVEKGCTESLYGLKSRCVIVTVPADEKHKCDSFMMDNRCRLKRA